jgi:hypothetical protein
VRAQLQRPAFSRVADLDISYLPYGELEKNREAIARSIGTESDQGRFQQARPSSLRARDDPESRVSSSM